ncbi:hypothetical protein B0H15DRAFT_570848 [Mycena belliarum]|uniref:Uncharacterized protein n=1 Tax=Mycena belliarum TaxID=1033014 RepID=A0AAD6TWI2_9AGAR|nr:hypothetical protein B0H15DRAFT_570848 [Mycena belliae]
MRYLRASHAVKRGRKTVIRAMWICSPEVPGSAPMSADAAQKLHDRLSGIVRSKEGKMVNVHARAFILTRSRPLSPTAPLSPRISPTLVPTVTHSSPETPPPIIPSAPLTSRRPPILTLMPNRPLYADSPSRYSSPAGSRSSSRRRPALAVDTASGTGPNGTVRSARSTQARGSAWFGESEPDLAAESGVESAPEVGEASSRARPIDTGVATPITGVSENPKALGIAFSWSDT